MNRLLSIFILTVLLASCSNQPEGFWRLNYDDEVGNLLLPYELSFRSDTLFFVNGYNFKQTSIFKIEGDSISISFKNGIKKRYSLEILSDSSLRFEDRNYFRTSKGYFSKTQSYELLGWSSKNKFNPHENSTTIHLIKDENDSTKVILNGITSNLKELPMFLRGGHGQKPKIYLFLGKGIELKDLSDAYCWIKYSGYRKAELVTGNVSFERFYSLRDYVDVDESTFIKFREKNSLPPPPPFSESKHEIKDVFVNAMADLNFEEQTDSVKYRYNFSTQLDIIQYFELTQKLNDNKNKKLKRLTTMYIANRAHGG